MKKGVHVIWVGEREGSRLKRLFSFSRWIYDAAINIDADVYHLHRKYYTRSIYRSK